MANDKKRVPIRLIADIGRFITEMQKSQRRDDEGK